jgi:hypothetical protein
MEIKMNIYKISQDQVTHLASYEVAIVAAESEEEARLINPDVNAWCDSPDKVKVELLGTAIDSIKSGIIYAVIQEGA